MQRAGVLSSSALALQDVLTDYLPISPTLLRVVRVFRVGRVLRLVKGAKGIRTLLFSLAVSMPALFNIGLLLFLIMFIFAIFGMSFFMHVRHTAGIDDLFNFETFFRSLILLFQISTSAGWDGVLAGLMNDQPPGCDNTSSADRPHGDCGSASMAILYLISYLIIAFLVVINMYIAVILENFSQATEDVQQGLTQDDFDMYYEVWERYDEEATQYIPVQRLCEFVNALEEPLRLPAPNYCKLVTMKIPICEGDRVHCLDILDALTKNYLGTRDELADDIGGIRKGPQRKDYIPISTTFRRQREALCARVIQRSWRRYRHRRDNPNEISDFQTLVRMLTHAEKETKVPTPTENGVTIRMPVEEEVMVQTQAVNDTRVATPQEEQIKILITAEKEVSILTQAEEEVGQSACATPTKAETTC